jgi:hypothetical protein
MREWERTHMWFSACVCWAQRDIHARRIHLRWREDEIIQLFQISSGFYVCGMEREQSARIRLRARYSYDVSLLIKPSRPAGFNGPERMTKRDDLPLSALHRRNIYPRTRPSIMHNAKKPEICMCIYIFQGPQKTHIAEINPRRSF